VRIDLKQLQKKSITLVIPSPPQIITRLLAMISEDRCSANELGELILKDPSLTARILKVANSPFYQFSNKIETVSHAISLLGQETIRMICVSESFLAIFPMNRGRLHQLFQQHNDHSLLTGIVARSLITYLSPGIESEKAFIAGLLHDIGKPILWYNYTKKISEYEQVCRTGLSELEAERMVFGYDHLTVGKWLADEWTLGKELTDAISGHHYEGQSVQISAAQELKLSEIIYYANLMAKTMTIVDNEFIIRPQIIEYLGKSFPGLPLDDLLVRINEDARPFFGSLFHGDSFQGADNGEMNEEPGATDDSVVSFGDSYPAMVKKALTLFNTYNYFLGNFQLGEAFYRMLENIQLSLGMSKIFIILYDRKRKQLVIKGTPAKYRQLLDLKLELGEKGNQFLSRRECKEFWFTAAKDQQNVGLGQQLAQLFDKELGISDGVFVPVMGSSSFVGGFVALCQPEQHNASMVVEFLNGYAVQLALAIRIYRLNKRMLAAEHDKTVAEMAGTLAHSLNQPLQTLSSYIYLLEKEMRVGSYGSSSRNVYCEKMKKALDEMQHSIKRFQSAKDSETTGYYGREKILSV